MIRLKLSIRLLFVKLPHIPDVRIFRDSILCMDPDERSYQDLSDLVERKLTFMELPPADFTVFYRELVETNDPVGNLTQAGTNLGDRVVVDTSYFSELLHKWWDAISKPASLTPPPILGGGDLYRSNSDLLFGFDEEASCTKEVHVSFEVEVNKLLTGPGEGILLSSHHPHSPPPPPAGCALLTTENLKAHAANQSAVVAGRLTDLHHPPPQTPVPATPDPETLLQVDELTNPPRIPNFFLRCVVVDLRFKTPKPGLSVTEIDLCDATFPMQVITAVSFDAVVQKEVKENLRCDGRQVIELRKIYTRLKNESDRRYETNPHPLLLRIDRHALLEIVQILPVPIHGRRAWANAAASSSTLVANGDRQQPRGNVVVRVRETLSRPTAVIELSDLVGISLPLASFTRGGGVVGGQHISSSPLLSLSNNGALPEASGMASSSAAAGAATGLHHPIAKSSSSGSSAPRRTTFSLLSQSLPASSAPGVVMPSSLRRVLQDQQEPYIQQQQLERKEALSFEPGLIPVTSKDVRARERVLVEHSNQELRRKERIRRRKEVSTACIICGLDCEITEAEAECMDTVSCLLKANNRNRGQQIPTFQELRQALCDWRGVKPGDSPTRCISHATFVNTTTKTLHVVHCRCAHLCTAYQNGKELEDIVWCDLPMQVCTLCGMTGACVACYHPECNEIYHVVCALFSRGYVNFGKKDPYLPCPACPRHTQVVLPNKKRKNEVLHTDESCWTDDIAFDSRVVNATDLRDPDENDGD